MRAILIGILAAFFSITFILNHAMSNDGGSWLLVRHYVLFLCFRFINNGYWEA